MAGRPSKCTPEVIAAVDKALRLRCTHELASQAAGIHPASFQEYLALGRDKSRPRDQYTQFAETVERAESEAAQACLERIEAAGISGQWTADAWLMERRYPQLYGRRINQIQGPNEGPIEITLRWPDSRFEDDATEEIAEDADTEGNGHGEAGEGGEASPGL